ncbi:MAG: hypothetical protein R8G66_22895 [Cytophagales bacterium]|nr:hypothetical protein [Cytophagales bacterium]
MSRIKTPDYTFSPGVSTVQGSGDDTQSQIWIRTFNATTDFSASPQTILDIGDDPSTTSLFSWFFIGLMGGDLAYANTVVGNSGSNRRSFANDLNSNTDYTYVIEMDATDQVRRAYLFEASDPSFVFQSDMRNTLSSQSRSPRTGLMG